MSRTPRAALAEARRQIAAAYEFAALARACAQLPIESTYYRARAGAALYNARALLTTNFQPGRR